MAKKILNCTNGQIKAGDVFVSEDAEERFGWKIKKAKTSYDEGCFDFFKALSIRIEALQQAGYSLVDATRKALTMELATNNISSMMYSFGKKEVSKYFNNLDYLPELGTVMTGMSLLEALELDTLQ